MALNANVVLLRSTVRGGRATLLFTGSANAIVQANSTVNSDIADASHANDAITGASISGLVWSAAGANSITVARGANVVAVLGGSGTWTAATGWLGDGKDPTANVVVTFSSAGGGTLYAEFAKQYAGGGGNVVE
jgi:hypothetical protein